MSPEADVLVPAAAPVQASAPRLPAVPAAGADAGVPQRFLTARFRSFYALLRDVAADARGLGENVPRSRVEAMVASLVNHISAGRDEALRLGGAYGATLYQDASYIMAALADEILLFEVDWAGRHLWDDILVEARACGTRLAGERVFERADALLAAAEPAHAELAGLFLMALALGFQGRWRDAPGGAEVLAGYRRRLRALAGGAAAGLHPEENAGPLFPAAYAHTLDDGRPAGLPPLRRWLWLAAALLGVYLVTSHVAWRLVTADVRAIVSVSSSGPGR